MAAPPAQRIATNTALASEAGLQTSARRISRAPSASHALNVSRAGSGPEKPGRRPGMLSLASWSS